MSIFSKVKNKIRGMSAKQAAIAAVFTLALAGAAGLGLAANQQANAVTRDYSSNAMMKGGAANAKEYISKLNKNSKYRSEAANFHKTYKLTKSDYSQFADDAQQCYAYKKDDTVKCKINGKWQTVLSDSWSIGRDKKANSWVHNINGKKYYADHNSKVFLSDKLGVMVMFNSKGQVQYAAMNSCGNQMGGKKAKVGLKCDRINKKKVGNNKYEFTTKLSHSKLASVDKVVYYADGKKIGQSSKKSNGYKITETFDKSATITSKVYFKVPGKHTSVVTSSKCKTKVTVTPPPKPPKEEKKPYYACDLLRAESANEENTKFRFTVEASYGDGATLRDADFAAWVVNNPDDKMTVTGVTQKDDEGNIYQEFEFEADDQERKIEATVNFNVKDGVKSKKCQTKVTPEKQPVCVVDGKEYPVGSPECEPYECPIPGKEDLPKEQCVEEPEEPKKEVLGETTELPKTGAASVAGIFFSATGVGASAYRLLTRRLQK